MADEYVDNSGNTEQFRAFVQSVGPDPAPSRKALLIGVAVAVVLVLALVVYLVS